MDIIEKAKANIDKLSTAGVMCAFDIVGREYLNNETSFVNHSDGLYDLIQQFELAPNEIVEYLVDNQFYNSNDLFLTFDGEVLCSYKDLSYYKEMILKKCDGECAEFILGELNEI